jgi:hypothetical protein
MPIDVAQRIDAALAAEALLDATAPSPEASYRVPAEAPAERGGEMADAPQETTPANGTGHVSRETSPATRSPGGRSPGATGPGRLPARRRGRRSAVFGTVFGVVAAGVSILLLQTSQQSESSTVAKPATSPSVSTTASGLNEFSDDQLETRVDTLLKTPTATPLGTPQLRGGSTDAGTTSDQPLMQPAPKVPYCVQQGTGRSEAILAAEQGTYRGTPAYLLVLANPADDDTVRVFVVDSSCVGSSPASKGKLLLAESYPRH